MRKLMDRLAELTRRKSFRFGLVGILALVVTLVAAQPVFAQTNQSLGPLDQIMSWLAAIGLALAEVIGKLVIAVLDITIPVMQYQGFTTSPVVVAGWAIVRDVVNMFFVVVLIVIAMGTIFGHSRFQWKQQVPKLMIFALVINFSKTLCGLMIDFAQVVMITFANALKDIAGGNFIQLLGLGDIFSLSEKAGTIAGAASGTGPGASAFDWFAASMAAVLMMVWVLAVVIMLLFVLVYRVVMLWILIVLAPLAWFMGGQSVFKSDAYGKWWENFICYTAIGPVITFFLWLTLAVAGSGFIAANDPGLSSVAPAGDLNSNAADFVTKIFEWQRLTSFVVGMAMLMVGFDAASKICHGAKGPGFQALMGAVKTPGAALSSYVRAGKMGGKGLSYVGRGGKAVGAAGLGAGSVLATAGVAGLAGGGFAALKPTKEGAAARAKGLRDLSKKSWVPAGVATSISKSADERQKELAGKLKTASTEEFKDASDETKLDRLKRVATKGLSIAPGAENAELGLLLEAIKDPGMRKKLDASGVLGKLYRDNGDKLKSFVRNTPDAKAFEEFEAGRPDLLKNKALAVDKLDVNNVGKLDVAAITDDDVQDKLKTIETDIFDKEADDGKGGKGRYLSEYEAIERGKRGKDKRAALKGKGAMYGAMSDKDLSLVPVEDLVRHATPEILNRRKDVAAAITRAGNSSAVAGLSRQPNGPDVLRQAFAQQTRGGKPLQLSMPALSGIDATVLEDNDDIATTVAGSLNDSTLREVANQYASASAEERKKMEDGVIKNIKTAIEAVGANPTIPSAERKRVDDLDRYFDAKMDAATGNLDANIQRYETRVNNMAATLAAAQARGDAAAETKMQAWLNKETAKLNNLRAAKATPRISRRS